MFRSSWPVARLGALSLAASLWIPSGLPTALAQSAEPGPPSTSAAAPAPSAAPAPAQAPKSGDPALAAVVEAGRQLYLDNCRQCHGTRGTAGVPLAKNPRLAGDPGHLIWAILTGPGYMPEFAPVLSDEQIAAISTYIMNSWGNEYGPVTAQNVQGMR
ncbi:c-type cytochrome [Prosthecomicrobium sp. N25]|uniref:c-type cytochrome n=1 Tax=Prosthecomicrobium sp. N25 TaxID=3129254 RepID=UPI003077A898